MQDPDPSINLSHLGQNRLDPEGSVICIQNTSSFVALQKLGLRASALKWSLTLSPYRNGEIPPKGVMSIIFYYSYLFCLTDGVLMIRRTTLLAGPLSTMRPMKGKKWTQEFEP